MRRIASRISASCVVSRPHNTIRLSSSFISGIFNCRVNAQELFPYPTRKFASEESENVQTLIEQIRRNDVEKNATGALIANEYGGLGLGNTAYALVCEELGTGGDVALLQSLQHCSLASCFIASFGTREIKGKYLTAMSDGTIMMGWAVRENNGPDISMNSTEAALSGDVYHVTGRKLCYFADKATHFLVQARAATQVETEDGPREAQRSSFFIVPKDSPGVTVVNNDTVIFDKAVAESTVGAAGTGYKNAMTVLLSGQYTYAAALLGTLKRAVQELRNAVPDRWAKDVSASCACFIYSMEATLYALTANYDVPTEDSFMETALAIAFVQVASNEWLSLLATATPTTAALEKCFHSARALLTMMETSDFLYSAAVCCGVEEFGIEFQHASTLQVLQQRMTHSLGFIDQIPCTNVDCASINKSIIGFNEAVKTVFVRNTSNVPHEQLLINRLGEAAALLYAAAATAARASMCISKNLPTAKTEKELASIFITFATQRVDALTNECRNVGLTSDELYKRIALELCDDALQ